MSFKSLKEFIKESSHWKDQFADRYNDIKDHKDPKAQEHIKKAMKAFEDGDHEAAHAHMSAAEAIHESLADMVLASAKKAGLNAKISPPLADRKKATAKLLKHRARELKRNPPKPREMPPRKTGFRSGAEDDTYGT